MEYLFLGFGMIYFVIAAIGIIAVPIIYFLMTVVLSVHWSVKEFKDKE